MENQLWFPIARGVEADYPLEHRDDVYRDISIQKGDTLTPDPMNSVTMGGDMLDGVDVTSGKTEFELAAAGDEDLQETFRALSKGTKRAVSKNSTIASSGSKRNKKEERSN